jgi:hypothetical protein
MFNDEANISRLYASPEIVPRPRSSVACLLCILETLSYTFGWRDVTVLMNRKLKDLCSWKTTAAVFTY